MLPHTAIPTHIYAPFKESAKRNIKGLSPDRQISAIRKFLDLNIDKFNLQNMRDGSDKEVQILISKTAEDILIDTSSITFQRELDKQKGYGRVNEIVKEGKEGKVTDDLFNELPLELQKKLGTALDTIAAATGNQGVKRLTGTKTFKGKDYQYELKFLGAFGDHRCYGNKEGAKVLFEVYDDSAH